MKILIDNGHGSDTPGKRSPDGRFLEWKYNREISVRVTSELIRIGYDARLIVPEDTDIPLAERCRRVNAHCERFGRQNAILVSIHCNAAGNGSKWMNARGWSVYTSKGNTRADVLATCLAQAAIKNLPGKRIRTDWSDGDIDIEEDFYLLRHTLCPACLTENMFMDCLQDRNFLLSSAGKAAITLLHVEGICDYLDSIR